MVKIFDIINSSSDEKIAIYQLSQYSNLVNEINLQDDLGNTPLILSFNKKYYILCKYLIINGADSRIMNKENKTILTRALIMANCK